MPHPEEARGVGMNAQSLAEVVATDPLAPANDLIQYGTWTPADASGAGLVLAVDSATWVKIGRLVIARAKFNYPATVSGANNLLSGLPFPVDATQASRQGYISYQNAPSAKYVVPNLSASTFAFFNNASATATNADLSSGSFWVNLEYITNP